MRMSFICLFAVLGSLALSTTHSLAEVVTVPCISEGERWRYIGLENDEFPIVLLKSKPWPGQKRQHPLFQPWMEEESPLAKRIELSICAVATSKKNAWSK